MSKMMKYLYIMPALICLFCFAAHPALAECPTYPEFKEKWAEYEAGKMERLEMWFLTCDVVHDLAMKDSEYRCFAFMAHSLVVSYTSDAEVYARMAIHTRPDLPWGYVALSHALARQGQYAKAAETLENMQGRDKLDDDAWIPAKIEELRVQTEPVSTEALDRYLCPTYSPTEEFEEFLKDYVTLKGRITDIRREKYGPPVAVFPGRNEDYEVVCELLDPSELKRYAPGDTITFVGLYDRREEHQLRLRYCKILDADF